MTRESPPGGTPDRPPDHEHVFDSQLLCEVCGNCALDLQEDAGRKLVAKAKALYEKYAPLAAGPAAQSPQVGAPPEAAPHDCKGICADFHCSVCGQPATEARPCSIGPAMHADCRADYETGRSDSDRPPVNPPVASADQELAALLREARNAIDELHGMYAYADLLARIDSALSRLAGQEGPNGK
jgi:hypothetical protein